MSRAAALGEAAKNAQVILPLIGGTIMLHDPMVQQVIAVSIGVVMGGLWRLGSMISAHEARAEVWRDIMVSALIGCANAVLALSIADLLDIGPLLTMGLGVIVGATGLRALPEIKEAFATGLKRKLLGDDVALIQPRDDEMSELRKKLGDKGKNDDRLG